MRQATPTLLAQTTITLIAVAAFAFMLYEPHLEGRNAHATLFQIYFQDPLLAYAYAASIPFFIGLRQAFNIADNPTPQALRTLKHCAYTMLAFVAVSLAFIPFGDPDDRPAGLFLRILVTVPTLAAAVAAGKFERALQGAGR